MSTVISYLEVDRGIAWWLGSADTTRPARVRDSVLAARAYAPNLPINIDLGLLPPWCHFIIRRTSSC
jgi:hypothetical protein